MTGAGTPNSWPPPVQGNQPKRHSFKLMTSVSTRKHFPNPYTAVPIARVAKIAGISANATNRPFASPTTRARAKPSANDNQRGTSWLTIITNQATEITIVATIDRSIPRPMITSAIPTPRMPRMETFWSSDKRLPAERNPLRLMEKTRKIATAMAKTMRS